MKRKAVLRRVLAVGSAAALVGASAQAADAIPGPISGGFFGVGKVLSNGAPVSGATVTLTAWPVGSVLDAQAIGDEVQTKVLAITTTDSTGSYTLPNSVSGLGSTYTSPDGAVDLDLNVTSGDNTVDTSVVAAVPGSEAATDDADTDATTADPMAVSFDLSKSTVTSQVAGQPAETGTTANGALATAATTTAAAPVSPNVPAPPASGCADKWVDQEFFPGRTEHFMNLYTYGNAKVDETVGSAHTLGVGVAVTGGNWSASGNLTVEAQSSAGGVITYNANSALYNEANYHHYTLKCFKHDSKHNLITYYKHQVKATSMHALLTRDDAIGGAGFNNATECDYYTKGTFHKTAGSNVTFSAGVAAPYVNLSAKASFSKNTSVYWTIPSSGAMLCGSTTAGWVGAPYAGTQKYSGPCTAKSAVRTADAKVSPDC